MQTHHLPTGTLTFVFTDIEGSTNLVRALGSERFGEVLDVHGRTLREIFAANQGHGVRTEGDSFFFVFSRPTDAVAAAVTAQRALAAAAWPHGVSLRVRMGMHTGEATLASAESGSDYVGFDVHRAARIAAAGHGGQVLVSETTRALVQDRLPTDVALRDLGEHRFKDLARPERVYQLVVQGLAADFPRLKSLDKTPNNLPTQLTSFIGREEEVREARRLLEGARLLTLTGPGGTGKTRLSLQIAAESAQEFPDGVYFVPLAPISDPALVASTIVHELGLQPAGNRAPLAQLAEHLHGKRTLLVLDNFEQILPAAPQLAELLRAAAEIKMLVSSRGALRVYGEQEFPVPPLRMPSPGALPPPEALSQYEAVRLFIDRALSAKPSFAVTNENAPAVAGICARLDGLPLAIELAAARIRLLPPHTILARLETSLSVLGSGPRDLPARQQTLRGAISWSYDLLAESAQRLFRHFSVFVGGAGLEEMEGVCSACGPDVLEGMTALVDQSLVRQREEGGEPRFFMLQTIREYGLERLAEDPDAGGVRERHATAYLALAERAAPRLMSKEQKTWLDRLELEKDNLRAAVEWAIGSGAVQAALGAAAALWRFWQMRGYLQEGRGVVDRILAMPGVDQHPAALAGALEAAGGLAYWQADMQAGEAQYQRALDLSRQSGDRARIANALYNLSFCATFSATEGGADRALALLTEALEIYRAVGDRPGTAKTVWAIADVEVNRGHPDKARALLDECISMFRALADSFSLGWALFSVGGIEVREGRLPPARRAFEEGLELFVAAGDLSGITLFLGGFARLEAAGGDMERSMRLRGAAAALQASSGTELATRIEELEATRDPTQQIDRAALATAWAEGQAMDRDRAVAYALKR